MKLREVHAALLGFFVGSMLFATAVHPAPLTIDFEDQIAGYHFNYGNFTVGGFRFSPSCGVQVVNPTQGYNSKWIGGSGLDCASGGDVNPEFTAGTLQEGRSLRVDNFGKPFSFLSVLSIRNDYQSFEIRSSKGGLFVQSEPQDGLVDYVDYFAFSGPEWTDVLWIMFIDRNGTHEMRGWDNMQFDVRAIPEPGTMLLIGLGLVSLAITRRKRRSQ